MNFGHVVLKIVSKPVLETTRVSFTAEGFSVAGKLALKSEHFPQRYRACHM